jgi:hypothetical protein
VQTDESTATAGATTEYSDRRVADGLTLTTTEGLSGSTTEGPTGRVSGELTTTKGLSGSTTEGSTGRTTGPVDKDNPSVIVWCVTLLGVLGAAVVGVRACYFVCQGQACSAWCSLRGSILHHWARWFFGKSEASVSI